MKDAVQARANDVWHMHRELVIAVAEGKEGVMARCHATTVRGEDKHAITR